jgi:hypothetical protein
MFIAYYCFVNYGILPHEYDELPYNEKELVGCFAYRDLMQRKKEREAR